MHHSIKRLLKNTFFGLGMSVWLILGGLLLCFSFYGMLLGIPMILLGVAFPVIELILGWANKDWTGGKPKPEDEDPSP
jgi:Zn-dependent membrane protease YugP